MVTQVLGILAARGISPAGMTAAKAGSLKKDMKMDRPMEEMMRKPQLVTTYRPTSRRVRGSFF